MDTEMDQEIVETNASSTTVVRECIYCSPPTEFRNKAERDYHYKLVHQFRVEVVLLKDDGEKDPDNGTIHVY
jgi:hypothetical protein